MKYIITILIGIFIVGAAYADDPGDPDSLYIGNLDGIPIVVSLDEVISVPLWIKTDDSVAFVHFPLATQNLYIEERLEGEHVLSYCVPHMPPGYPFPDDFAFLRPDSMNASWTNQSLVVWWPFYQGIHTQYEWCHKFDFYMRTTSNPAVLGDTAFCFDEGYNPINGYLLIGLTDGLTEFIPDVDYGSIYFAITEVNEDGLSPDGFELIGAHPNPFNASTTIEFTLPEAAEVRLSIYNILGQKVAVISHGIRQAGRHSVAWDAGDLPSGIYFARLEGEGDSRAVKMVLLK